jgi:hypothetical protein
MKEISNGGESMKKYALALLLLLFMPVFSAEAELLYSPKGFRGVSWGDTHKKLGPACVLVDREKDYGTVYIRRNEEMDFFGVKLDDVTYAFYRDQFLNVTLEISGKEEFDKLKALAFSRYGKPEEKRTHHLESYRWDDDKVFIILDYIPQTSDGQLLVTYIPLLDKAVTEIENARTSIKPTTPAEMDKILD